MAHGLADNWATSANQEVIFDVNGLSKASFQTDVSLKIDGTKGDNTRWKFYSDTADSSQPSVKEKPSPYLDVSFSTTIPVNANLDLLSIDEGGSNLLQSFNITDNDTLLEPSSETRIISVNGSAWGELDASDSDLYAASFDYKKITGDYGTLFIRPSGKVYYEHDGSNVSETITDKFTYKITNGGEESDEGELRVVINPKNQAPSVTLEDVNLHADELGNGGVVVASYKTNDPDGDNVQLKLLNGGPKNTSGLSIYTVDSESNSIKLTAAGSLWFETHSNLPDINVIATDSQGADSIARTSLHIAQAKQYFIDQANGTNDNSGLSLNKCDLVVRSSS